MFWHPRWCRSSVNSDSKLASTWTYIVMVTWKIWRRFQNAMKSTCISHVFASTRAAQPPIGPIVIHKFNYISGQIIATSNDLTPNGGLVREIPLFQGNLGW